MNWFEVWLLTVVALFQLKHGLCSDSENEIPLKNDSEPPTTTTPASLNEDDPNANEVESTGQKNEIVTETSSTSTAKPDNEEKRGEEVTTPTPDIEEKKKEEVTTSKPDNKEKKKEEVTTSKPDNKEKKKEEVTTSKPDNKEKKKEEVTTPEPNPSQPETTNKEGDTSSSTNSTDSKSTKNEGNKDLLTSFNTSSSEQPGKNKTEKESKSKSYFCKPRPFLYMNPFGRHIIIKNIDKGVCKGWFEGERLTLREMLALNEPVWIRHFTFTWPGGRLSITYYNYKGKLHFSEGATFQKIYHYMAQARKKVCFPSKNIWDQFKTKLLGKRNSVMENDDDEPRLFYGERFPVRKNVNFDGKPETEIESHEVVYRYTFEWAGTRMTVTYYGKQREHGRQFVKKIRQIGNYTIDDMNSKIITYLVDDKYLFL